jgi:transposase
LSEKELDRLRAIHEVERGYLRAGEAAQMVGISYRQFKRVRKRHREEGDKGLAHRLRGRASNRRTPEASRARAVELIREKYPDFGPTLASEKLEDRGIRVSEETVRKWMIAEGLWKPRKRRERHRTRRERRRRFGELVQMDGSHQDWFEGRGERPVLIAMIDDATNRVVARFHPGESMRGLMQTLRLWLETHGRPRAIYADRHSLWVARAGIAEDKYDRGSTQLRRALDELNVGFIAAHSPQAKGRVERLFGTLQDRLVKEMRLRGIDNIDDANRFLAEEYLPRHNARFTVEPGSKADAHRKLGPSFDLHLILSEREERVVQNDYTIRWHNRILQIGSPAYPGLRGGRVTVAVLADGSLRLLFRGRTLDWQETEKATHKSTCCHSTPRGGMGKDPSPPAKPWVPPPDHPWRNQILNPR